ncbi:MAG: Omp28-related outer membrane protein [Dysgonamonadaceae bacterium]|jgi:hypothetical protein|nr:Omp28-related outer membrane protein [Dysgonamonadaceae bacterium]
MNKTFISFFLFLLSAGCILAQESFRQTPLKVINGINLIATDEENAFPLRYCNDNINTSFGVDANSLVEVAIVIPKNTLRKYVGNTLTRVLIGFGMYSATDTKVFVRNGLNDTHGVTKSVTLATAKWNGITLDEPYEIKADQDLVIGYSFKSGSANERYHIGLDDSDNADPNGDYIRYGQNSYGKWMHLGENGFKNLCIFGIVEGENISSKDVNFYDMYVPTSLIDINETLSITGSIKNEGAKPVTSLEVSYKTGENEKVTGTLSGLNIAPGDYYTFGISGVEFEKKVNSTYPLEVKIEKVNGSADDYPEDNTLRSVIRTWEAPTERSTVDTESSNKNVVLEEFTGVYCQFCPDGHKRANEIKAANPGRVSIINIHQGVYAVADPDFTTIWGNAIANQTGLTGYPAGTVNRHAFGNVTALSRGDFKSKSTTILNQASYVNIGLKTALNTVTRELTVDVELYYTKDPSTSNRLNIALVQDSIIASQVGATSWYPEMGSDASYQHNHMLRDLLTGQWGEPISQTSAGSFVVKRYLYTVPEKVKDTPVNLDKIEIVAFVAEGKQEIITGCSEKVTNISTGIPAPEVASQKVTAYIADDYLFINSYIPVQGATVYTVSGQQVLSVSGIDRAIPVATLASGVYIIKLKTAEGEKTVKIVR